MARIFGTKSIWIAVLFIATAHSLSFAKETAYTKMDLLYGISIDVPAHWVILARETRKNIAASGEAVLSNAGLEGPDGKKVTLLAINAVPAPTGAMIRVSVMSPPEYTQADLVAATPNDLREIRTQMLSMFKRAEKSGGVKIIDIAPVRVQAVAGKHAMVSSYSRESLVGGGPWSVTQYKIPTPERVVEITLSHRDSDAPLWRPILERIKRSIVIP